MAEMAKDVEARDAASLVNLREHETRATMFRHLLCLLLVAGSTHAASLRSSSVTVPGVVSDVVDDGRRLLVSSTVGGTRQLNFVDVATATTSRGPDVPATAIAFDLCNSGVVFVDERGLVSGNGDVLIAQAPLLGAADPSLLPSTPVCPLVDEYVLAVRGGLTVVHGADVRTLRFAHHARSYSGTAGRSLRGERGYATAVSTYAPRLLSFDVDSDGDLDLVASHEHTLAIYRRGPDGLLGTTPLMRDLGMLLGASSGADLRVHRGPGASLLVAASDGPLPETSDVVVVGGTAAAPLSTVTARHRVEGLAVVFGAHNAHVIVGRMTTNLVALSTVMLTGKVSIELIVDDAATTTLPTVADVRAGRIDGALPVLDVDIDGDGDLDIVDLGEPGAARALRNSSGRYVAEPAITVPRIDRTYAGVGRVVLLGRTGKKGTTIAVLSAR
jgi:hypothetical protein